MRGKGKEHNRYLDCIIYCFIIVGLVIFTNPARSIAKVTGNCANCHTMHNSQEGTSENIENPVNYGVGGSLSTSALTKVGCIGCHSNTGSETIKYVGGNPGDPETSRIPIVYNIQQPAEGTELAGGNFYWMTLGDDRGHNILAGAGEDGATEGISLKDSELDDAPGRLSVTMHGNTCIPCHKYLNGRSYNLNLDPALIDEPFCGCKSCHVNIRKSHHAEDHVSNTPDDYNHIVDYTMGCYRFLSECGDEAVSGGVHGIESYDWEQSKGLDHAINQYQGSDIDATTVDEDHSISDYCGGCHGDYHAKDRTNPAGVNASPWFRHPAHIGLPAGGEFDAYTEYNLDAPVARKNLNAYITPSERSKVSTGDGYGGNDQVMCLSCHRAHASPYPDILRWDYEQVEADDGIENRGCKICHTGKN